MADAPLTTKIQVEQCARCGGLTWGCFDNGLRVSAEPGAVSVEQYREALLGDVRTFAIVKNAAFKPTYLVCMLMTDKFQPGQIVLEHRCGAVKHWSKPVVNEDQKAPRREPSTIHVVGGTLSNQQGGSSPLATTRASSTAHAMGASDMSHHFNAVRLLQDGLGIHALFKEWE